MLAIKAVYTMSSNISTSIVDQYREPVTNSVHDPSKKITANNVHIPLPFSGIPRKILYNGRKYHSGTICEGVVIALAGI
jgi:hypothetical protein